MLSQNGDSVKDVTVLHADRARSSSTGRWLSLTAAGVLVLLLIVGFIVNEYNTTVSQSQGARQGVVAVFTAATLIGSVLMIHWFVSLLAPGMLRFPWTVAVGATAAWIGRGYIEAASKVPGGTDGISVALRILLALAILFTLVGLAVKVIIIRSKRTGSIE